MGAVAGWRAVRHLDLFQTDLGQGVLAGAGATAVQLTLLAVVLLFAWGLFSAETSGKQSEQSGCGCLMGLAVVWGVLWWLGQTWYALVTGAGNLVLLAVFAACAWYVLRQSFQLAAERMGETRQALAASGVWALVLWLLHLLMPGFPVPLLAAALVAAGAVALDYQYVGGPRYDQYGNLREQARREREERAQQAAAEREAEQQRRVAEAEQQRLRQEQAAAEQRRAQEAARRQQEAQRQQREREEQERREAAQRRQQERLESLVPFLPTGSQSRIQARGPLLYLDVSTPLGLRQQIWADEAGLGEAGVTQVLVHFEKAVQRVEFLGGVYVMAPQNLAHQLDFWEQAEARKRRDIEPPKSPEPSDERGRREAIELGLRVEKEAQAAAIEAFQDWKVLTGVLMPRGGDIDLLLTRPDGQAFAVDIKAHAGRPSLVDGVLHFAGDEKAAVQRQLHIQAEEAVAQPVCWQPRSAYAPIELDGILFVAGEVKFLQMALSKRR
ncbi:hypothetical protein ACFP81_09055 [Deinococcus lacus]|uniref:NERD domain-containing protein n=1 Tax=Deinococcus lacus TaxID=392561 RepID=A0ABW1YFB6_9DEIO